MNRDGLAGAVVRDMRRTCQLAPNMAGQGTFAACRGLDGRQTADLGWVMALRAADTTRDPD